MATKKDSTARTMAKTVKGTLVVLADTPEIRGMLNASRHLLRVEEA